MHARAARLALVPALALVASLLAGCSATTDGHATLAVHFAGRGTDTQATLAIEPGHPSASYYEAANATLPAFYTAFDQLAAWAKEQGHTLDVQHASFGFFLCGIDGKPGHGAKAYWNLDVNGTASMVGMEQVKVVDGSAIAWTLTDSDYPNCPDAAGSPTGAATPSTPTTGTLALPPTVTFRSAAATLQGTGTPGLAFDVLAGRDAIAHGKVAANGTWAVPLGALRPGHTNITAEAVGTSERVAAATVVVREVQVTLEAKFSGYPGATDRSDAVWVDVDGAASAPLYDGKDLQHPGYGTVHDAMLAWSQQAGAEVVYTYSNGLGYSVSSIDGAGSPLALGLLSSTWCYSVDGATADKGLSTMPVAEGDVVTWTLGCV